jgi:hypothetical protein
MWTLASATPERLDPLDDAGISDMSSGLAPSKTRSAKRPASIKPTSRELLCDLVVLLQQAANRLSGSGNQPDDSPDPFGDLCDRRDQSVAGSP